MKKVVIYTDGGSRGNPGPAAYGAVLKDEHGNMLASLSEYLGITTNNVAEYSAVLAALTKATELGFEHQAVEVFMDSEVVQRQLTGKYRVVNQALFVIYSKIKLTEKKFSKITYTHVRREYNKEADALVNSALDSVLL